MSKSSRTTYREKRIELISGMITNLAKILIAEKRNIEKINLPQIKKVDETIGNWKNQVFNFPPKDKKE